MEENRRSHSLVLPAPEMERKMKERRSFPEARRAEGSQEWDLPRTLFEAKQV